VSKRNVAVVRLAGSISSEKTISTGLPTDAAAAPEAGSVDTTRGDRASA
jgi:hypothetical protein